MPSSNPKHRKKISTSTKMGVKKTKEKCSVSDCTIEGTHHLAAANLEGYLTKLNWTLKKDGAKSKRIALCKKHYKLYKKLKNKDEKYSQYKNFGAKRPPKREKSHNFLE
jgi:hypothetical protein